MTMKGFYVTSKNRMLIYSFLNQIRICCISWWLNKWYHVHSYVPWKKLFLFSYELISLMSWLKSYTSVFQKITKLCRDCRVCGLQGSADVTVTVISREGRVYGDQRWGITGEEGVKTTSEYWAGHKGHSHPLAAVTDSTAMLETGTIFLQRQQEQGEEVRGTQR